jgi:NadR type nicotinamide-nucleotide adenylyltransferase
MVLKIATTGPESTGKTTLCQQLAQHYGTVWVPEFARGYLGSLGRAYVEDDLLEIALGQARAESEALPFAQRLLFCDTDFVVLKIWSEHKYGHCHPRIEEMAQRPDHALHLLCAPDLPWAFDPLRENPLDRELLFGKYLAALRGLRKPFALVSGEGGGRLASAIRALGPLLDNSCDLP